jgi:hypothetical protein
VTPLFICREAISYSNLRASLENFFQSLPIRWKINPLDNTACGGHEASRVAKTTS